MHMAVDQAGIDMSALKIHNFGFSTVGRSLFGGTQRLDMALFHQHGRKNFRFGPACVNESVGKQGLSHTGTTLPTAIRM